ncbi:MAG TPA: amidohydrolase family protein, partial [Acidimicrobiales bacterium]|nr:amidohydrolase family protein [Acidimicrobiales bacterium]
TARGVGLLFGLVHRTPWDRAPAWRALRRLPLDEKLARLRDDRQRLIDEGEQAQTVDLSLVYVMADREARYDHTPDDSLAAHAARRGVSPVEAFVDMTLERDGLLLLNWPFLNQDLTQVEEMLHNPTVVLGLADAGAHVGQIMDASQPTFLLTYWARERGSLSVGEAVRRLTSDTAGLFGIVDRGVLRPGAYADVNVIDYQRLRLHPPEYVHDFPGGAGRFVQRASGYDATIVNGNVFMEAGAHTGALAGTLLRS